MGIKGYQTVGIITFAVSIIMILTALWISKTLTVFTIYVVFGLSIFVALKTASAFADT